MKILVTGGAGFIGSNIVDGYLSLGHEVTVLDDFSSGRRENLDPRVTTIEGDLRDSHVLDQLRESTFDILNHHAAQIDVRVSVADPGFDADINVVGTLRLIEASIRAGVKKIVFASSGGAIYGDPLFAPQTEDHPELPISPYGCAKLAVDQYLHYYRTVHDVSSVSLRYGNVYGPRQRKDGEAGVVAIFAGALMDGEQVTINGTGEQTRDYVFVGDVVRANMAASGGGVEGRFNVGTGVETSVTELFHLLRQSIAPDAQPVYGPAKKGEQARSVLDGTKLRRLAALPEPVSLRKGLDQTVEWFRRARESISGAR